LTGVLPDTGGPLLPLFALGVLALGFAGILLLRRLNP
jgi:LPXTG-motif cell wall-anchored protein